MYSGFMAMCLLVVASCKPENPQPNDPNTPPVATVADTVTASWTVTYRDTVHSGSTKYVTNQLNGNIPLYTACNVALNEEKGLYQIYMETGFSRLKTFNILVPSLAVGTYTIPASSSSLHFKFGVVNPYEWYTTDDGHTNATVTITEVGAVKGFVKGTFSATVGEGQFPASGTFEVFRIN